RRLRVPRRHRGLRRAQRRRRRGGRRRRRPVPPPGGIMTTRPTVAATVAVRPLDGSRITGGFWARRLAANRTAIPLGYQRLVEAGHVGNLEIAAGTAAGDAQGASFRDSDVYKWLEAVAWEYARDPDEGLLEHLLGLARTIGAAQLPDGYL